MARWRPRIVVPVIGAAAVAVVAVALLVGGSSSPHHPPGLTPLTTTTMPDDGSIWSGEARDGINPTDIATGYVQSVLGGYRSVSMELERDVAIAHFTDVYTDVYLRKDTGTGATPRWLVTGAATDVLEIGNAVNDYGLADANITVLLAGQLTVHVGEPSAPANAPIRVRAGEVVHIHQPVTGTAASIRAVLLTDAGPPALAELVIRPGVRNVGPPVLRPAALFPATEAPDPRFATPIDTARGWAAATLSDQPYEIGPFTPTGPDRGDVPLHLPGSTSTLALQKDVPSTTGWSVVAVTSDRLHMGPISASTALRDRFDLTADVTGFLRITPGAAANVEAGRRVTLTVERFFGTVNVRLTGKDGTVAVVAALLP